MPIAQSASKVGRDHRTSIRFKDVSLGYPMAPLQQRSIKSDLLRLSGRGRESRIDAEYVRALKEVSVEIGDGERVGIIGRNGSGKSSFLRVAAGVYLPQSGQVEVVGQVQALFDIGVGFETHATGRENIVYRGLVMGLMPDQINARVEDIIAFADIGEFIDMPLRSYSAGMGVRLAFAISTFLEGDVLLIDEIFGAGDLAFYTKAKERMLTLVDQAGIVCFASHDLATIRDICNRALWIHGGKIAADGSPADVTREYEQAVVAGKI
jgi:lipopolysaccharide transport system ATP-binding protein